MVVARTPSPGTRARAAKAAARRAWEVMVTGNMDAVGNLQDGWSAAGERAADIEQQETG